MFECELVWEFVGCAAEDRSVEEEVQRRAAAQQFRECAASGVCATHCSAPSAYGGLRAAMRGTKRGRSHEFRRSWCCMIPCAELGGSSLRRQGAISSDAELIHDLAVRISASRARHLRDWKICAIQGYAFIYRDTVKSGLQKLPAG